MRWPSSATPRRATASSRPGAEFHDRALHRVRDPAPAGCTPSGTLDRRVYAHGEGHVVVPATRPAGMPPGARFEYQGATATLPTPVLGTRSATNFQCNIPVGARRRLFRPVLNGHGLFGTADQVNSDSLYALGSFGLMACATDEIGMAREDIPSAAGRSRTSRASRPSPRAAAGLLVDFLLPRPRPDQRRRVLSSSVLPGERQVRARHHQSSSTTGQPGAIFGGA
jgi:hypothetical protein